MSKLRFVIDTNTLVSSILIPSSVPAQAFTLIKQLGIFLVSLPTIEELQEVLTRPKFDKYVSASTRSEFVAQFIEISELIAIEESIVACRDAKANKFLEVAVNGQADYLITGDRDLLSLHPFRDIQILNPAKFVNDYHNRE